MKTKQLSRLTLTSSTVLLLASVACAPSQTQTGPVGQVMPGPRLNPVTPAAAQPERGSATIRIKLSKEMSVSSPIISPLQEGGFQVQVIPAETTRIEIKVRYDANDTSDIASVNIDHAEITAALNGSGEIIKTLNDLPVGENLYLRIQAFEPDPPNEKMIAEYEKTDFKVKGKTLTGGSNDSLRAELERVEVGDPPRLPECVAPTCDYTQRVRYSWNDYTFKISDPNGDDVKLHINWGDGSPESISEFVAGTGSGQVSLTHSYREEGTYTLTAVAYDRYGQASEPYTQTIQITSYPSAELPMDPTCSTCPETGVAGEPVSFDIRIGNVDGITYKASVDWGDGTTPHPESNTVTTTGVVTLNKTFAEPGTYTVRFANWDQFNARSENLLERTIVIGDEAEPSPSPSAPTGDFTLAELGMSFKTLSAGTFTMGAPESDTYSDSDERPQHSVTLSAFQMQTTEVTQKQWYTVMGGWSPAYEPNTSYGKGDNYPMYYVSWCDIVGKESDNNCSNEDSFLKRLNAKGQGTFRLPTEAEWEYAARAGTTTQYACGNYTNFNSGANAGACPWNMGWFGENNTYNGESYGTKEVARKQPNAWGLYDMHGNVWEWTQDWYGSYSSDAQTNPTGPSTGSYRVGRGGDWNNNAHGYGRSSGYRDYGSPSGRGSYVGFRLVRLP